MNYTISLTSFLTVITFSVVFPLILPIGLLYFSLRYFIQKYNLLCLFAIPKEGLSRVAESGQYFLEFALVFFQLVTSLTFMLSQGEVYYVLGSLFALGTLVQLATVSVCFYRHALKKTLVETKSIERTELLMEDFRHPLIAVGVDQLGLSGF